MPRQRGATEDSRLLSEAAADGDVMGNGKSRPVSLNLGVGGSHNLYGAARDDEGGDDDLTPEQRARLAEGPQQREMDHPSSFVGGGGFRDSLSQSQEGGNRSRSVTGETNASFVTLNRDDDVDSVFSEDDSLLGAGNRRKRERDRGCYGGTRRAFLSCVRKIPLSSTKRRFLWRCTVCLVLLIVVAIPSVFAVRALTSAPSSVTVVGLGSSFADVLYNDWFQEFTTSEDTSSVPTTSTVSSFTYFTASPKESLSGLDHGTANFVGIDYPGNASGTGQAFTLDVQALYSFPTVAGALGIIYNKAKLPTGLNLTAEVLVGIFNGTISLWNDPLIAKANPGFPNFPSQLIKASHFTSPSGSTFVLSSGLSKMSNAWLNRFGEGFLIDNWNIYSQHTTLIASDAVMISYVERVEFSIGYVMMNENVVARVRPSNSSVLRAASIVNPMGQSVAPSLDSIQKAVSFSDKTEADNDLLPQLLNVNCSLCYPLCSFTYMLLPKDGKDSLCRYKLQGMHEFWTWAFTDSKAAQRATVSQLVLLPKNHHEVVLSALTSSIECEGLTLVEWSYPQNNTPWWAIVLGAEVLLFIIGLAVWQTVAHRRFKHKSVEIQREVRRRARSHGGPAGGDGSPEDAFRVQQISARADLLRSQIGQDELTLLKQIGSGAFGEVYLGRFRGTKVAIKRQLCANDAKKAVQGRSDEKFQEFLAEASLLARLRHPNIVQFLGATMKPPHLYIVTDWCSRGALSTVLFDLDRVLSPSLRMKFSTDTAQGMNYLHTHTPPIVHRDLKTQNLLVTSNWDIKVADFGISRVVDDTRTMTYCGTVHICAPEVISNQRYSESADIFSYAICLWEIWTRNDIWPGLTMFQIMEAVVDRDTRPPIDNVVLSLSDAKTTRLRKDRTPTSKSDPVPREVEALIQRCWLRDAGRRPSFAEILDDLRAIRKGNKSSKKGSLAQRAPPTQRDEAAEALAALLAQARELP
jgi:serine/threonine protein kinase/ABC-type phosphate transport system substrate-binding protein